MTHVVTVPEIIWEWAQRKSGKTNPAGWIRENCLYAAMIEDIEAGLRPFLADTLEETTESRWAKMGMEVNFIDPEFTEARTLFVEKIGGDDKAMAFLSKPSIKEPRGWLMDWWRKQKPQAV